MSHELLSIRKDRLSPEELVSVTYLEERMRESDELAILARIIHQQIAFGRMSVRAFADQIGAFTPDGIYLDGDDEDVPLLVDPQPELVSEDGDDEGAQPDDSEDNTTELSESVDETDDEDLPAELSSSDTGEEEGSTKEE